jgi:hypothetical protein
LQYILVEFLSLKELQIPFEDSTTPTKVLLHFHKYYL